MSSKSQSLTSRAAWIGAAKLTAFFVSFWLPLVIVRRLSQADFGLYKQVFLIVGSANMLLPLGFAWNLMYFLPRERERRGAVVMNVFLYNFAAGLAGCLVLILRPDLIARLCSSPALEHFSPLIGVVALLWITSGFLEIAALANQDLGRAGVFIVVVQLSKTLLMLSAVSLFGTVRALLYAAAVQAIFQLVVLWIYLNSRFPGFWLQFDWRMMRSQISYSVPVGAGALLVSMQTDLHSYFVSHQFGPSAFAIYAIGCFELPLIGILTESVSSVTMPQISIFQQEGRSKEIIALTAGALRKLSAVYFPLYALLMTVGPQFIVFLFTPRYASAWPIFAINLTLLPWCGLMLDPVCRAHAHVRFFILRLRILLTVVMFVGLWFVTHRFGMVGAITTVVILAILEKLVTAIKVGRILGVERSHVRLLRDVGKLAVASAAAAAITSLARNYLVGGQRPFVVLEVCGIVFLLTYVAAILALRIPNTAEIRAVRTKLGYIRRVGRREVTVAAPAE